MVSNIIGQGKKEKVYRADDENHKTKPVLFHSIGNIAQHISDCIFICFRAKRRFRSSSDSRDPRGFCCADHDVLFNRMAQRSHRHRQHRREPRDRNDYDNFLLPVCMARARLFQSLSCIWLDERIRLLDQHIHILILLYAQREVEEESNLI